MNLHELGGADKLINRITVDLTPDVPVVTDIRLSQELRQPPGPAHARRKRLTSLAECGTMPSSAASSGSLRFACRLATDSLFVFRPPTTPPIDMRSPCSTDLTFGHKAEEGKET